VIKTLEFARACIYNWLARYRADGWQAIETDFSSGRPKKLGSRKITWVYRALTGKGSLQMKFEFAL